eukprot:COSAG01_NODE_5763_length_4048_cov_1.373259_3_plen_116_part_00
MQEGLLRSVWGCAGEVAFGVCPVADDHGAAEEGGAGGGGGGVDSRFIPCPTCGRTFAPMAGATSVASVWAAVVTEIYLCNVCSCQEILRRNGRGQPRGTSRAARRRLRAPHRRRT